MVNFFNTVISIFSVTQIKIVNSLVMYIFLCIGFKFICFLVKLSVKSIVELFGTVLIFFANKISNLKNENNLEYNSYNVWYIKLLADVNFFSDLINYDIFYTYFPRIRKAITYDFEKTLRRARNFSIENLLSNIKNIFNKLFSFTLSHFFIACVTIFVFYYDLVFGITNVIKDYVYSEEFPSNDVLNLFETISIIVLIIFFIKDTGYKARSYRFMKEKRFNELITMEEEMLYVMLGMKHGLKRNINKLCEKKGAILENGRVLLLSKQNNINENLFKDFADMSLYFNRLKELDDKFNHSSFIYAGIKSVDKNSKLNQLTEFWWIGLDSDTPYKKRTFLCKTAMISWYKDYFIINAKNNCSDDEINNYLEEASEILDNMLEEAFELELNIKRYEKQFRKRFKRINTFSKIKFTV